MSNASCNNNGIYTVEEWLFGCVRFPIPEDAVAYVLYNRGIDGGAKPDTLKDDGFDIRLLKADLYKWLVIGPSKVGGTSDSDNGWSHSEGGWTLTKEDKSLLLAEANAIYDELEPESVFGKRRITVHSMGIMPAKRHTDGTIDRDILRR